MESNLFHRFVFAFCRTFAGPILKRKFRYKFKKQLGPTAPSLIVVNHCTNFDPALVALGFSEHMYFLASEHAFRAGFASKVLKTLFDPIPFNKARADVFAIKEMIRRLRAGENVCVFPEGDMSFAGTTMPISASIAKLAKTSGADLITYRLEGGYFTSPRWAKTLRKGEIGGEAIRRYSSHELKEMSEDQVLQVIERDLHEDAYQRQKSRLVCYSGKNLAENIETAFYLCPNCKKIGTIRSKGDRFFCDCGLEGIYTETGTLEGDKLPFLTLTEWGSWQGEVIAEVVKNVGDDIICSDEGQLLYEVHAAAYKTPVGEGLMSINNKVFHCVGKDFPLDSITKFAIVGQMTLLFAVKDGANYEVRSTIPRSALKYREIFKVLKQDDV